MLLFRHRGVRAALVLIVGLFLMAPAAASAQKVLRWKLAKGEKYKVAVAQDLSMNMTMFGKPIKMTTDMDIEIRWTVNDVNDKGVASINQKIERVVMAMDAPNVGKIKYDSASEDEPEGMAKQIAKGIRPLVGIEFVQQMNALGEVLSVKLTDKAAAALKESGAGDPLKQMLEEGGLNQMAGHAGTVVPEKAVAVGDTWTKSTELTLPQGKFKAEAVYTYEGTEQREGKTLDKIGVAMKMKIGEDGTLKIKAGPGGGETTLTVKDQKHTGAMYFDSAAGRFVETNIKQEMTFQTSVGEMKFDQNVVSNTKMTIEPEQ